MHGYTPMMRQFTEIKSRYEDSILFFRMGDFYEMFLDDAVVASRILGIALTSRDAGDAGKVPMCGVPYHAAEAYIAKLISSGRKVAICEQVEDPAVSKGLVKREVIRIVTPATHHDAMPDSLNYVVSWHGTDAEVALAVVEFLTGAVECMHFAGRDPYQDLLEELVRVNPREAAIAAGDQRDDISVLLGRMGTLVTEVASSAPVAIEGYLQSVGLDYSGSDMSKVALANVLRYLDNLGSGGFGHFTPPRLVERGSEMALDAITRRNLELTRSMQGGDKEGSLLAVLDHTRTPMGARMIRRVIEQPLRSPAAIRSRHRAVAELLGDMLLRRELRDALGELYDLERLSARVATKVASPRDLKGLGNSFRATQRLIQTMSLLTSDLLVQTALALDDFPELAKLIAEAIVDSPPLASRDGGYIRDGFNAQIDKLRSISRDGKSYLVRLEASERESTGIKSMKIGFNKVFGYYLEVSRHHSEAVPAHYVRKQTLVNAERYITDELKSYEEALVTAEERLKALEQEQFELIRDRVGEHTSRITEVARAVATIDLVQSFAEASARHNFRRPEINTEGRLVIESGRHPVVESIIGSHAFVPNDASLGKGEIAVITGPNMAGKSTYMRQTALIVLMSQIGCFVPAARADLPVVDRVFTRVGASDNLVSGQSTFMVEMTETSVALAEATDRSLILFDEVGRGTSTYDGMALAQAIMEYIHEKVKATTLFSTHYHELTSLADTLPRCRNLTVAVMERGREVVFLRRVQPGKASKSYGIHVAELAGLPHAVTERAYTVLRHWEKEKTLGNLQMSIFDLAPDYAAPEDQSERLRRELVDRLKSISADAITPLQALTLLHELSDRAKEIKG